MSYLMISVGLYDLLDSRVADRANFVDNFRACLTQDPMSTGNHHGVDLFIHANFAVVIPLGLLSHAIGLQKLLLAHHHLAGIDHAPVSIDRW